MILILICNIFSLNLNFYLDEERIFKINFNDKSDGKSPLFLNLVEIIIFLVKSLS